MSGCLPVANEASKIPERGDMKIYICKNLSRRSFQRQVHILNLSFFIKRLLSEMTVDREIVTKKAQANGEIDSPSVF